MRCTIEAAVAYLGGMDGVGCCGECCKPNVGQDAPGVAAVSGRNCAHHRSCRCLPRWYGRSWMLGSAANQMWARTRQVWRRSPGGTAPWDPPDCQTDGKVWCRVRKLIVGDAGQGRRDRSKTHQGFRPLVRIEGGSAGWVGRYDRGDRGGGNSVCPWPCLLVPCVDSGTQ